MIIDGNEMVGEMVGEGTLSVICARLSRGGESVYIWVRV